MALSFTIDAIEATEKTVTEWDVVSIGNTTLFVPAEGYTPRRLELVQLKEQLLADFLELGDYLYAEFSREFVPMHLDVIREQRQRLETGFAWSEDVIRELSDDDSFYFFRDPAKKQELLKRLYRFVSRYGFVQREEEELSINCSRVFNDWVSSAYAENGRSLRLYEKEHIKAAFYMVIEVFETYMSVCRPQEHYQRFTEAYPDRLYDNRALNVELASRQVYNPYLTEFGTRFFVPGLTDFICLVFILMGSGATPERVTQCRYCGGSYITSNPRTIYCSPACRNRANVKKNYDKKKQAGEPSKGAGAKELRFIQQARPGDSPWPAPEPERESWTAVRELERSPQPREPAPERHSQAWEINRPATKREPEKRKERWTTALPAEPRREIAEPARAPEPRREPAPAPWPDVQPEPETGPWKIRRPMIKPDQWQMQQPVSENDFSQTLELLRQADSEKDIWPPRQDTAEAERYRQREQRMTQELQVMRSIQAMKEQQKKD